LAKKPDEVVPYKILPSVIESVKEVVGSRLTLFNVNTIDRSSGIAPICQVLSETSRDR
jgi:hypothetical protein